MVFQSTTSHPATVHSRSITVDKTLHQPCQHRLLPASKQLQTDGCCCEVVMSAAGGQATKPDLGVALHHDIVDVGLQRHADVLALLGVKLEDVQHASHTHLEEDCLAAAAELHDVAQLCRVQILLGHRPKEVHSALVDAQDQLGGQQPYGVLNALHCEEDRVACREATSFRCKALLALQCISESMAASTVAASTVHSN